MATRCYVFFCDSCAFEFEEAVNWNEIVGYKPPCKMCKSNKEVYRNYSSEKVMFDDAQPRTLGELADRNSKKLGIEINGNQEN